MLRISLMTTLTQAPLQAAPAITAAVLAQISKIGYKNKATENFRNLIFYVRPAWVLARR